MTDASCRKGEAEMDTIGFMAMPEDFRYADVFARGRPVHGRFDEFSIRHPGMDRGKRAKIFAPFDALRGFGEAVSSKDVAYEEKVLPGEEEREELDRRLRVLRALTGGPAGKDGVKVSVTYYEPCADENSESYGLRGRYVTVAGPCRAVDAVERTLRVGGFAIPLDDVRKIEGGVFGADCPETTDGLPAD